MFNIVQRRKWFFLFSGVLILIGFIAMGISAATTPEHTPIRLSIDFLGSSLMEFGFAPKDANTPPSGTINEDNLTAVFSKYVKDVRLQRVGEAVNNRWEVRTSYLDDPTTTSLKADLDAMAQTKGLS